VGLFGSVGKALSSFFTAGARPASNATANGGDGIQSYGGYLQSDERRSELQGKAKWVTYANAANTGIVATGLRYAGGLLAGTAWHAEPNERGGADADRGVEIVTEGLINARMPKPFSTIVRRTALYKYFGYSLHEWSATRRADGMIVFSDIAHRPQHTIERWDKPDDRSPWQAVGQLGAGGVRYVIPRGRLLYAVDDTLTDSPDGVGLMRHVVELVRRLGVLEGLEGLAYETDLRGMPIGRAPIVDLKAAAQTEVGNDKAKIEGYVSERTQKLREALQGIVKSPEKLQYLLLDSGTYRNADQSSITAVQKWAFELLRGDANGVDAVAAAIGRLQLEIARVLGIEFAMIGGGNSAGTYGMHDSKVSVFATSLQTTLSEIAAFAENDLARVLVGLNGLDPDTCTPKLVAEPISTDAIEGVCIALSHLAQAGLQSDDEAIAVIRRRMRLPPPPEPSAELLGALGEPRGALRLPPPGIDAAAPAPVDPAQGEVDIPVDDLGEKPSKPKAKVKQ